MFGDILTGIFSSITGNLAFGGGQGARGNVYMGGGGHGYTPYPTYPTPTQGYNPNSMMWIFGGLGALFLMVMLLKD